MVKPQTIKIRRVFGEAKYPIKMYFSQAQFYAAIKIILENGGCEVA